MLLSLLICLGYFLCTQCAKKFICEMKNLFFIFYLVVLSAVCNCQRQESRNISSRFFFFPQNRLPPSVSGGCTLASLARKQSRFTIYDLFNKFSRRHYIYGKCPMQADMTRFNSKFSELLLYNSKSNQYATYTAMWVAIMNWCTQELARVRNRGGWETCTPQ